VLPAQRAAALPDVPTVGETVPGYEVSTWSGIGTAMGTPEPAIETLSSAVKAALDDPGIKTRLADLGATPTFMTAAAFGALIASEIEKWAKVIKTSGIKPE
jgi:tripartite-type tricarboxylate transporter receptor subunit TctC